MSVACQRCQSHVSGLPMVPVGTYMYVEKFGTNSRPLTSSTQIN